MTKELREKLIENLTELQMDCENLILQLEDEKKITHFLKLTQTQAILFELKEFSELTDRAIMKPQLKTL